MITEDFCSYEVAKLLKEKGFDSPCMGRYSVRSKEFHLDCTKMCNNGGLFECAAPTLQMAMRWLRKVYNLHIWADYSSFDFNDKMPYLWNIKQTKIDGDYWGGTYHKSYEEAVEAALKYALENLI